MAWNEDFSSYDIRGQNQFFSRAYRNPPSHLDWDMWRKIGQPGTYQAPPGSPSSFRGITSGAGGPNYGLGTETHYNMFSGAAGALGASAEQVGKSIGKRLQKRKDSRDSGKIDGDSAGDGDGSEGSTKMADGAPAMGGRADRSQSASITMPASSRAMKRSRRGDFSSVTQQYGLTMNQGSDVYGNNYGQVMGGISGSVNAPFQSGNTGGIQNTGYMSGGGFTPPPGPPSFPPPTDGTTPPPPPTTTTPPPTGGTPPEKEEVVTDPNRTSPISPPPIPFTPPPIKDFVQPPAIGPGQQPTGELGGGPSQYGNTTGVEGAQQTTQGPTSVSSQPGRDDRIYGIASDTRGNPNERQNAIDKLRSGGFQGPFIGEPARPGMSQPQGRFRAQDSYMGIPVGGAGTLTTAKAQPYRGNMSQALPQYGRMAQASFAMGSPTAVSPSAGVNKAPKKSAPKATEGPKSVASKKPAPKGKGKK